MNHLKIKKFPIKVGKIDQFVISTFNLQFTPNTPIFLGQSNLAHIQTEHPTDFAKYGNKISEILSDPDYIAKHPKKNSVEYIKKYYDHTKQDYVLVAVRASTSGVLYVRSLFVMNNNKVQKYQNKGALISYPKK